MLVSPGELECQDCHGPLELSRALGSVHDAECQDCGARYIVELLYYVIRVP
jgi:hypothetical protein